MSNQTHKEAGGKHYRAGSVQPWDLTRHMESSGNAHVDSCRCNVIKYAFRLKGQGDEQTPKLLDDLRKAGHYIQEAVDCLTAKMLTAGMDELPFAETPQEVRNAFAEA